MATSPHQVVEAFYRMVAAEHIQEKHSLVTLSPWPSNSEPPPSNVLLLDRMDDQQIDIALGCADLVLAGSTFSTEEELEYAKKYLPMLAKISSKEKPSCVILFQLATPGMNKNLSDMERHMHQVNSVMGLCMDEMVFLPELKPHLFHQNLKIALVSWHTNIERITTMLSHEITRPSDKEIEQLEHRRNMLLWHDIPTTLMPTFKQMDNSLVPSSTHIGKYAWVDARQVRAAHTYASAKDENGQCVTVRTIDKDSIWTAEDLEGIFREFRFLSDVLEHPQLPKCIDMLHGPEQVYLIFDGPSLPTVKELLKPMDGKRASPAVSLDVFSKLAETLAYMHSLSCVHRNISACSVRIRLKDSETLSNFKLVDFEKAVQIRSGQKTIAPCGSFPAMAPEMVHGEPYIPHLADCWSAGVVLLEMAGGLGVFSACLHDEFRGDARTSLIVMEAFFLGGDPHKIALTFLGGPDDDKIITYLQRTLQTCPENRREIGDVLLDDKAYA